MSTHIAELVEEGSDHVISGTLIGPTGVPVGSATVSSILATLRDKESDPETLIFTDREVFNTGGGTLGLAGEFALILSAVDLVTVGAVENQLRLLTLKITHSGTRKKNQEITFYIDALQDAS